MEIKIVVAAHKPYWMPQDPVYFPLHVGKQGKDAIGFPGDDTGDNISAKNSSFCELTGIYWAWKNLRADAVGLVHYRRYFSDGSLSGEPKQRLLTGAQAQSLLEKNDILLPKPRHYWIETNASQYAHAHHASDLEKTREILVHQHPEAGEAFDRVMNRTWGHRFNMFIMKYPLFCEYCEWMFGVLFELEKELDISSYDRYNARIFGFIGERLMDVWLESRGYAYKELPYVCLEKEDWLKKGWSFLQRKFRGGVDGQRKG